MKDWNQTTALVTGANRGIGRALVEALLERGAKRVWATARNIESLGFDDPRVTPAPLDVRDPDAARRLAEQAGDVDLLLNNAGTLHSYDLLTASPEALATDFDTNFFGLLHMARSFAPVLEANQGAMVNVLTLVSVASMPGIGGYSASKAAAWSLTQALRAQLGARGVFVHGVYPGAVDTDMIRDFEMPKATPASVADAILEGVASGQEDIAPDPMSRAIWATFLQDPKAVERQFGAM